MSSKGEENSKRRKRIMKKTYRNMALAAACHPNQGGAVSGSSETFEGRYQKAASQPGGV